MTTARTHLRAKASTRITTGGFIRSSVSHSSTSRGRLRRGTALNVASLTNVSLLSRGRTPMSDKVYAIVDEFGTPRYVGQTSVSLRLRLQQHRSAAKRKQRPLDVWLRDYPAASIIVLQNNPGDADECERRWIKQMRDGGVPLLNLYDGGRRSPTGLRHTEGVRRRISEARKGKPLTEAHRAKLSAAHTGVPLGESHREAIGNGARGLKRSEETRGRMSASKRGSLNPMSAEQRAERARRLAGGDAL